MNKQDKASIEVYILSVVLINRLDTFEDSAKKGVKYHTRQLIKEIENQDKALSEVSGEASQILSKGVSDMLDGVIETINK